MDILDKIFYLLKLKNIEQQEFAEAIGVRKQAISEWKKGTTKSYMKYIDKIADYFDVTTDYLLGVEENENSMDQMFSEEIRHLIKESADLNNEEIDKVREYIELLKLKRKH